MGRGREGERTVVKDMRQLFVAQNKDNTQYSVLGSDSLPFFNFQEQTSIITSESILLRYWRDTPPCLQTNIKILVICPPQVTTFSHLQVRFLRSYACSFQYEVLDYESCFRRR